MDLIYIDPPFNSNRNYEVFWGETKEKRAFEDRHASTQAYIEYMRPRCVELARVLKDTGSFYYYRVSRTERHCTPRTGVQRATPPRLGDTRLMMRAIAEPPWLAWEAFRRVLRSIPRFTSIGRSCCRITSGPNRR